MIVDKKSWFFGIKFYYSCVLKATFLFFTKGIIKKSRFFCKNVKNTLTKIIKLAKMCLLQMIL